MIDIKDKTMCCGCEACVQSCPHGCIAMHRDEEGFLYPAVNRDACTDCGLCERVCPMLQAPSSERPIETLAAKTDDEAVRANSSSGGVFSVVAQRVISEGGVVFGAAFNDKWEVEHIGVESVGQLSRLRGSKYVQSRIGSAYAEVRRHLKEGRKVLFSGTPCQIAGLRKFLRRGYDGLVTIEVLCHGAPSPGVWEKWLTETVARQCDKNTVSPRPNCQRDSLIEAISFRNKRLGWKKYSFALALSVPDGHGKKIQFTLAKPFIENAFMRGFLSNLYLRPSCHDCHFRGDGFFADITLGDLWGVNVFLPQLDDDRGTSIVMVNTQKGVEYTHGLCVMHRLSAEQVEEATHYNGGFHRHAAPHPKRQQFFRNYVKTGGKNVERLIDRTLHRSLAERALNTLKYRIKKLLK